MMLIKNATDFSNNQCTVLAAVVFREDWGCQYVHTDHSTAAREHTLQSGREVKHVSLNLLSNCGQ